MQATAQSPQKHHNIRLIGKLRHTHPKLKLIVTADGLYSKQPFIDSLKAAGMVFILVAKPDDHKILFQEFADQKGMNAVSTYSFRDVKGRQHLYEWINQIPLNGTKDADNVNFFRYSLFVGAKRTYHNSWVTDIDITKDNVIDLVKAGRARLPGTFAFPLQLLKPFWTRHRELLPYSQMA